MSFEMMGQVGDFLNGGVGIPQREEANLGMTVAHQHGR